MNDSEILVLTESETARRLGVSISGLRKWRRNSTGPRFLKIGRLIRYRTDHINAWLRVHEAGPETEYPLETTSGSRG
jgi:predicted DNA-binding transcriptional regulator AlpA